MSSLPNGIFAISCQYKLGESCGFSCNDGYMLADPAVSSVSCGPGLVWDRDLYTLCKSKSIYKKYIGRFKNVWITKLWDYTCN